MEASTTRRLRYATMCVACVACLALLGIAIGGSPGRVQSVQSTSLPVPASRQVLNSAELDQLVAPIALYPDPLLSEVLMASTYPLEIAEANRWSKSSGAREGAELKDAAANQRWDTSVKSLIAVPEVLAIMKDKLHWTQKLGEAVLAGQADVMQAVQRLRWRAQDGGKLNSNREQTVSVSRQMDKDYIAVAPAQPQTIHVPYYDPAVVYGAWPHPAYPPYVFEPPGDLAAAVGRGVAFATGAGVGAWAVESTPWGGSFNWGGNNIYVRNNISKASRDTWVHNPEHRRGVRYASSTMRQKYAHQPAGDVNQRMAFRGHESQDALQQRDDDTGRELQAFARYDDRRAKPGKAVKNSRPKQTVRAGRAKAMKRPAAGRVQARFPRQGHVGGAFTGLERGTLNPLQAGPGAPSAESHGSFMDALRSSFGAADPGINHRQRVNGGYALPAGRSKP
ncbi:DUF3300 domain-containing protein [Bradyrhizobium sp. LHD-71]|uniref:DUF3300 domain-containing protein n=1 Tax=Bradyrhizobium sp. LHD-71 TaxID=3072141 RepID=UPI00280E62AF|nr:DUF3300 domain-containing protein [Bradyrhizobium sp. LHD-71]MDQ8730194.1 DUF3300 domain-containing protein [Bradyrhizobium sp. LHD-71]